ncbi:MAG: DNA-directed RNA polymerase subunit alpha [Planctomycetaceae bacterium]|nr:DNA-directed RNA polymerase subunit alpha [Planctomycetaceae bacterium]MCL2306020.1 DNA-directed RNA polymerase subunit alpha [Planctomycetaceae bacterium]
MRIRWRGLELPSKVICDRETLTESYGKFIAEPFERGFGNTIGNSLRRVLLSSLEGSAIIRMKLKGALHEFTSIRGVLEDVTEISLNVKALVVKSYDDRPKLLRIEKNTVGPITAADIQTDGTVDIINKDHLIATLTDNVPFELEMVVENGRGYIPASEQFLHRDRGDDIGYIPLDAAFSPVIRVQYSVEETRVGQKTNYDKLTMEIWTDASIDPEYAMVEAAKILRKHLNPFIQYDKLEDPVYVKAKTVSVAGIDPALESKLGMTLEELSLSVRATNCLQAESINTVRDLVARTEDSLLEVRNFGETTLNEVKEKLNGIGLRLGMRLPPASPQQNNPLL